MNKSAQQPIYTYSVKQRTVAKRIGLNMILLLLMYIALVQFNDGSQAYAELISVGFYAIIGVECVLFILGIYFWRNNKAFSITLTTNQLSVFDPLFGEFSWQVNVKDIATIQHSYDAYNDHPTIYVITKDGNRNQLTLNYSYSRKDLYEGLSRLNSSIKLPESPNRFSKKENQR